MFRNILFLLGFILTIAAISLTTKAQNFTDSNLPIVIINTDINPHTGLPYIIPDEPKIPASMKIIYREDGSRNYITDQTNPEHLNYDGRIGIEMRGSTSQIPPKKPYSLTTRKDDDISNNNVSLLGMPKENDWILNSFAFDPSMLRDVLSYQTARSLNDYAVRSVYCEVIINDDYKGLYILTERIKIDSDRLNLVKLTEDENELPELSGGYITKADKTTGGDPVAWSMPSYAGLWGWVEYIHHQPKPDNITSAQHEYIKSVFFDFQDMMTAGNHSIVHGYPSIIDVPTFIDFILMNELASNVDAYQFSTFFHKDRGGKLRAGPVWDFNLTYGNDLFWAGYDRSKTNVWQFDYDGNRGSKFWKDLFDQADFRCFLAKRWHELTQVGMPLHYEILTTNIDSIVDWISEAVEREDQRWGTIYNHNSHISEMKTWLQARISWLNNQLTDFQACADPFIPQLVISKIHYHPKSEQGFDKDDLEYIEITHKGAETIGLTGIYLSEPGIGFQFAPYMPASPGEKIYLASNAEVFEQFYGFAPYAQYSQKLSNKSFKLVLKDAWGNIINEVHYSDSAPWPSEADGNGPHLHLIDIDLDNSLPENWIALEEMLVQVPEKPMPQQKLEIMPNPTVGLTHIRYNHTFDEVRIYNTQAQIILNQKLEPTSMHSFNTSAIKPGIYRVAILKEGKIIKSTSLIIQ